MCYLYSKEGDSISLQGATELNIAKLGIQLSWSKQLAVLLQMRRSINCYVTIKPWSWVRTENQVIGIKYFSYLHMCVCSGISLIWTSLGQRKIVPISVMFCTTLMDVLPWALIIALLETIFATTQWLRCKLNSRVHKKGFVRLKGNLDHKSKALETFQFILWNGCAYKWGFLLLVATNWCCI